MDSPTPTGIHNVENNTEQSSNMADQVVNLLVKAQDGQLSKLANTISLSFEATL